MILNPHHLELFYFVARHAGVSEAARQMPYGIGPSAISRQLCRLERQIGVPLCQRRPFKLTGPGKMLFTFLRPFFEDLPDLIDTLRRGVPDLVRLAASHVVLREYMPSMVRTLRHRFPELRLTFSEGLHSQIQDWLAADQVDLAVTLLDGKTPADCQSEPLLHLPMILLVPASAEMHTASELWCRDKIDEPLICPGPGNPVHRLFFRGLRGLGVEWPASLEANSFELVESYVRDGLGIGVSLAVPGRSVGKGLRALALSKFPTVELGMIWRADPSPATLELMGELRRESKRLSIASEAIPMEGNRLSAAEIV